MATVVEISGIGFPNKGAELMLAEVSRRLRNQYGFEVVSVCRPDQSGYTSAQVMGRLGVSPLAELSVKGIELGGLFSLIPQRLIYPIGAFRRKDVDIVLDASGLKFSEDWGVAAIERGERYLKEKLNSGARIVLLPQAFGPFKSERAKASMKRIIEFAELIYARDQESYDHLRELSSAESIKQCPDLTIGCECDISRASSVAQDAVLMIPNQRMLDKGKAAAQSSYKDFMLELGRRLVSSGERVVLLNHEGAADRKICDWLHEELGLAVEVLEFSDPLELKATISLSKAVITSRFHGAVSSLSQAIPCFTTSWSHKYKTLLDDFDFEKGMINLSSIDEIDRIVQYVNSNEDRIRTKELLAQRKTQLSDQVAAMWDDVYRFIGRVL